MSRPPISSSAGSDTPITEIQDDRYGFDILAKGLVRSIMTLSPGISTVIGIEGKWGAGKTSLLNLLLSYMRDKSPPGMHILQISPWLNPAGSALTQHLLIPVAAILDEQESCTLSPMRRRWQRLRRAPASPIAKDLINYAQQASGHLAPVAELAGNFVPGLGIVAKSLKTVSRLELSRHKETAAAMRARIEERIAKSGASFIVVIDDLDRLEPSQAVEVLRLVRSVADFTGFRYVMCYDQGVLAHAVEQELGVENGRQYLQKIIPLAFSLPLPEAFNLRREFLHGALQLYARVNHDEPDAGEIADLRKAANIYGQALSTPREVSLVLNALEFRYAEIRDYVYFPDLCLLHIIRVTNSALYDWIEQYLTVYAVVASGEGNLSDVEQQKMADDLRTKLKRYISKDASSPSELGNWVPGISDFDDNLSLFVKPADWNQEKMLEHKRLGSRMFWRYYFALAAPQNVLPPALLNELLSRFANPADRASLAVEMVGYIKEINLSHVTWYDHIFSQLTRRKIATLSFTQCEGLLWYLFHYSDMAGVRFAEAGRDVRTTLQLEVVCDVMRHILTLSRPRALYLIRKLFMQGRSKEWLVSLMRDLLWGHGIKGTRSFDSEDQFLTLQELSGLQESMAVRMSAEEMKNSICSGQLKLATALEFFQYRFSDSFGGNPQLYSCGLSAL